MELSPLPIRAAFRRSGATESLLIVGHTEVQNLGLTPLGGEDVGGFDIPVNDPFRVGGIQRIGNLDGKVEQQVDFRAIRD